MTTTCKQSLALLSGIGQYSGNQLLQGSGLVSVQYVGVLMHPTDDIRVGYGIPVNKQ